MPAALSRLARSEQGIAVPMALLMIVSGLALAGAAIIASVHAQRGTVRDQDSKAALAAADAGAQVALMRQNKVLTTDLLPCVLDTVLGGLVAGAPAADGWCATHTGTVGDATYTYRVHPATLVGTLLNRRQVRIVSVGTADGVSRRVAVTASTATGDVIFGGNAVAGIDEMVIENNSEVVGNVGSNASVDLLNNARQCGDVTYGLGGGLNQDQGTIRCPGFNTYEQQLNLPPPDPGTVHTDPLSNDNDRFFNQDRRTPSSGSSVAFDAATRTLTLNGAGTLTLGGANYSLCRLVMDGSSALIVARGATVKFYFDTPENCGQTGTTPYNQISITGSSKVITTSQTPSDLAFIVEGSESIPTTATLTGTANVQSELLLYAPRSDVTIGGTSAYLGAIAGQTTHINGGAIVSADPSVDSFGLDVLLLYERERYIECTGGAIPTPPDSRC